MVFWFSHSELNETCLPIKVIANKEALRIRHGKAKEEMSSIHLRHLPRSPVLSPPWSPTPSGTPVHAPCPPPRRQSPRRSRRPRPLALPSTAVALRSRGGGTGRPFPSGLSPITPRRLRGLPAPGNRRETRPRMPAQATLRLLGDPCTPALGTQPSELLPAQRPPGPGARG